MRIKRHSDEHKSRLTVKRVFLLSFACLLTLIGFGVLLAPSADAHQNQQPGVHGPSGFADLAEKLLPSVVNISSTQRIENNETFENLPQFPPGSPFEDFFEEFMDRQDNSGPSTPPASLGSGFVIDAKEGYIVTNNHVIKGAQEVRVTFHDDETIEADIIGRDEKTDLAVLKIKDEKKLSATGWGNSDDLRVGDWILAIGNPFGLGGTVTTGIVSAQQRDINAGPYDDFIQTDASINRGNSGGPMFNAKGEVIGINTAIFSPSGGSVGIGFAIPTNLARPIIDQLIEHGRTRRGWLGVRIQSVTEEIAESLGLTETKGALVASITPKGPAEKAKLQPGDVILQFDGKDIPDMRALPRIVAETPIGKKVRILLWRDGKERKSKVSVGELEKAEEEGLLAVGPKSKADTTVAIETVGLNIAPLDDSARDTYNIPSSVEEGVLIVNVEDNSEAAEKGLSEGDVIVEINQQPIATPREAKRFFERAVENDRKSALLLINRGDEVRFVALKLKKEK